MEYAVHSSVPVTPNRTFAGDNDTPEDADSICVDRLPALSPTPLKRCWTLMSRLGTTFPCWSSMQSCLESILK
jgi:hypothetical protein